MIGLYQNSVKSFINTILKSRPNELPPTAIINNIKSKKHLWKSRNSETELKIVLSLSYT